MVVADASGVGVSGEGLDGWPTGAASGPGVAPELPAGPGAAGPGDCDDS